MVSFIYQDVSGITRQVRERLNGHRSFVVWLTGFSGAGKSTIAKALEEKLYGMNYRTFLLSGDNLRKGLCADLGFSDEDRTENVRRAGETVKLFLEAGIVVVATFISPFRVERRRVKDLVGHSHFVEVYCRCPLSVCESRDVKGLYRLAREQKLKDFTGISSRYEEPIDPDVILDTNLYAPEESVNRVMAFLYESGFLQREINAKVISGAA